MERLGRAARALLGRYFSTGVHDRVVHDLGERIKELTTLHAVARLLNESGEPADLLRRVVAVVPPGWQYPEIAAARISGRGIDVRTDDFTSTAWIQRTHFPTGNGETGFIEVVYRKECPASAEGPFLAEERSLLDSLGGMLAAYFERMEAAEARIRVLRAETAQAEAQAMNDTKDQFLATLSHELRAPLNVMLGWTTMLLSNALSPERAARGAAVLERNVRIQARLIDDLLDVSRIVTGKLRVDMQDIDPAVIASLAIDAARPAADAKRIQLGAALSPSLLVHADPARLQQIVSNLLTNALNFTPEDGCVDLSVDAHAGNVRIIVRDSGTGITSDLLPHIFERFRQGDATTRRHGGLGLGLSLVKYLVERHGGHVTAESEGFGLGSTFTITLPMSDTCDSSVVPRGLASLEPLLDGVRVLVVDDEPDARETAMAILEQCGARPTAVASMHEALKSLSSTCPDVLLCDVATPDKEGCSLIRRVRTELDGEVLPAVALSAYADDHSRTRTMQSGFQAHLVKPIEPALLISTLARLVHRATR